MSKLKIGTIVNTVGLKGECKIHLLTDFKEERFKPQQILVFEDGSQHEVIKSRFSGNVAMVFFKDITTIEQAQRFVQQAIYILETELHDLAEDEFYFYQLLGCEVFEKDVLIGEVIEAIEQPNQTLLRIKDGDKSFLLPFLKVFVIKVDIINQRIDVQLIEGMRS